MPEITVRAERRVAGVKAYLKGIPQQIGGTDVWYIAIGTGPNGDLPTRYNIAIPLLPIDSDGAEYKDYIPNDGDKNIKRVYSRLLHLYRKITKHSNRELLGDLVMMSLVLRIILMRT